MTATSDTPVTTRTAPRLPVAALIVMACTTFIGVMTETMPAGLLPQISRGISVSEGAAGQFVSAYALGMLLAAIPAGMLTRGVRRKPLLLAGLAGFVIANTGTALAPDLAVALAVRFIAGAFAGLLWGMLGGAPGQHEQTRVSFAKVLRIPGVVTILAVAVVWMLAHNLLYAYIAAYLQQAHLGLSTDLALVIFGVAAIAGIAITGMLVDHMLRRLTLASVALFVVTGAILLARAGSTPFAILALVLWGIGFGGSATQLQTAAGSAAGENADVVIAMVATCFNLGIFVAGIVGAVFVDGVGARAIPVAMIVLAAIALVTVGFGRRAAFRSGH